MQKLNKTEKFIRLSNTKHKNFYGYTKCVYEGSFKDVVITCPKHGDFIQKPSNHLAGKGCKKCGRMRTISSIKLSKQDFLKKAAVIHGEKYGYQFVKFDYALDKVKILCKEHGVFEQQASQHMAGHGCFKCRGKKTSETQRSNTGDFIKKSQLIHGEERYNYNKVDYKTAVIKVIITCKVKNHGDFSVTPNNHLNGRGCPKCKMSKGEAIIHQFLTRNNIDFLPQYKIKESKENLFYDFLLVKEKILIEFQGEQHYRYVPFFHDSYENFLMYKARDDKKRLLAKVWGYRLVCISYEIFEKLDKEDFQKFLFELGQKERFL